MIRSVGAGETSFGAGDEAAEGSSSHPRCALPDRYEERGFIGAGGMGEVWRVRDRELGRTCAFKVLRADRASQPNLIARFLEEARIGAQLQHPNIPAIYDGGRLFDDPPWFTMKEVHGSTFDDQIREAHGRGLGDVALAERVVVQRRAANRDHQTVGPS